jgi:hypothetical protein
MNDKNGNAKASGGYGYEQGYDYINRHHDIVFFFGLGTSR